jgi:cytochrome c-type protein NapB
MKRLGIISLFILLFISFIVVWNYSYYTGLEEAYIPLKNENYIPIIPSQKGMFQNSNFILDYANMPFDKDHQRTLKNYYKNRAYYGAPPSIPHPIKEEMSMGENKCLQCHQSGGFTAKFNAYTPITPHPEMVNCRQCHVVQTIQTVFKEFNFDKLTAPMVGFNNVMFGSPPVIPHQIQMRENCLSCHAGPSAPKEIRVTHPERINCKQCHVFKNNNRIEIETFTRNNNYNNED